MADKFLGAYLQVSDGRIADDSSLWISPGFSLIVVFARIQISNFPATQNRGQVSVDLCVLGEGVRSRRRVDRDGSVALVMSLPSNRRRCWS